MEEVKTETCLSTAPSYLCFIIEKIAVSRAMFLTHRIPVTKAYVNPQAVYPSAKAASWLGSPLNAENLFAETHGKNIPMHYLDLFQHDMLKICMAIGNDTPRVFSMTTEIFNIMMYVDKTKKIIMLKAIFLRPCAEGYGFFRVILFQLAQCCIWYECDFYVENPFESTRRVMQRAFLLSVEDTQQFIPHMGEEYDAENNTQMESEFNTMYVKHNGAFVKTINYMIVRNKYLKEMDLAISFGLIDSRDPEKNLIIPLPSTEFGPQIYCNAHMFPNAYIMNHGPGSAAHGHSEVLYDDFDEQRPIEFFPVIPY